MKSVSAFHRNSDQSRPSAGIWSPASMAVRDRLGWFTA